MEAQEVQCPISYQRFTGLHNLKSYFQVKCIILVAAGCNDLVYGVSTLWTSPQEEKAEWGGGTEGSIYSFV